MSYDPNVPKAPLPPVREGGNRAIYFIVGGLVVLAAVFVFIFTTNDSSVDTTAPAATTTEPVTPAPAPAPAPAPEGSTGGTTTNQ